MRTGGLPVLCCFYGFRAVPGGAAASGLFGRPSCLSAVRPGAFCGVSV